MDKKVNMEEGKGYRLGYLGREIVGHLHGYVQWTTENPALLLNGEDSLGEGSVGIYTCMLLSAMD